MKKYLAALTVFLQFTITSMAQNNPTSVSGKVIDQAGKAAVAATVTLLQSKDSILAKTAITDSKGEFDMQFVKPGKYFLSVTSIGYKKNHSLAFELSEGQKYSAPTISISQTSTSLTEVSVETKKQMIEVKADKTVFNIENSINATGSNAFELLRKSPGVSVDKDDNISMQGKNGVKIYIDGKPSQMNGADLAAYLKSVNSADIESIEMITNPSAKYDAAGNAGIINIRLKKNKKYGANASISTGIAYGFTLKTNNSLSVNYRNKKINIFSNYSNNFGKYRNLFNLYRKQNDSIYDQHSVNHYTDKTNNFKVGADYFVNAKNTLGFIVTGNFNAGKSFSSSQTSIIPLNTDIPYKILFASSDIPGKRNNIDYNLNYRYADTSGTELNIDADLVTFRRTGTSYQPNFYREPVTNALLDEKIYRNNTPTDIDIYTAKIDYEKTVYKGKLGIGGKYSNVKTKNIFDFYNVYGGSDFKDLNRSNKFNYKENVNALYLNYNRPLNKKTTIQAGVRLENTISEGNLISSHPQPDDNVKRNYTDLFPSGAITYTLNAKNTFNLNYSRRIDRPSYQDLNPFEDKLDELTYRKGNAFLRPQYTNSFQLSHTFLSRYTTALGYSHIKDFFAQIIDTTDKNRSFITQKNIAEQNIYSFNISAPITITKWWNAFLTFNGYNSAYKADFGSGKKINLNVTAFSLFGQQTFSLKKGTTFELSGFFNSPSVWGGTFKTTSIGTVDIGVQQPLFKGQGNIKLSYSDLFYTGKWKGTSDYGGAYLVASGRWESQQLKMNFTYRFGNSQVKAARQRKTATEEESKRLNSGGGLGGQ